MYTLDGTLGELASASEEDMGDILREGDTAAHEPDLASGSPTNSKYQH